jgi:histidinol-phosphate aminotransferase
VLTILDEAYFEFVDAPDAPDGMNYLNGDKPLLVFRTFSKCHALAGLRVGFGIGSADLVDYLDRARLPFNVNVVAEAAAVAALEDDEHIRRTRELARSETAFMARGLQEQGWEVYPSQTNFVFAKAPVEGEPLTQALLRQGIIVRPLTAFGLPPEYFRISHGTRAQNERFLAVASRIVAEQVP